MAAADAGDLLILLNPFVYPHVLGTVFHPERYLAWDWWEGVIGGWCPASRNRVRLCWLFTPLAWARNRGLHSGLGETALTPEVAVCPCDQDLKPQARPLWAGVEEAPAREDVCSGGCISATGYWKPRWSDKVQPSSSLCLLIYFSVRKTNEKMCSLLCLFYCFLETRKASLDTYFLHPSRYLPPHPLPVIVVMIVLYSLPGTPLGGQARRCKTRR